MNFKKMEVLSAIERFNTITQAAEFLGIKQPTVTFHMKSLEKEANTTLFKHSGGKITLTNSGRALLFYAKKILRLSEDARNTMKFLNSSIGYHLQIGSSMVPAIHILPKIITSYKDAYPFVSINVNVATAPEIQDRLRNYDINLGIISSNETLLEGIRHEKLCTDKMVLVFPKDHLFARKKEITKNDLSNERFILHTPQSTTRQLTDAWLKDLGLYLKPYLEISSMEAIKQSVANHIGISILSELSVQEDIFDNKLAYRPLPVYSPSRNIYLIYNEDDYRPEAVNDFIEQLKAFPYHD